METHDDLVSAKANLLGRLRPLTSMCAAGRSQDQVVVRFRSITMMLVPAGLSTLKPR